MPNAAIYCRVSTRQQADEGSSLDSQEAACRKLASHHGFTNIQLFKEDFPGTELQRPLLDELRAGVKAGRFQAVFCYSTDRLSRSPVHLALIAEECQRAGIDLVFVTEPLDHSPEGQLLTFVRGWAAQLEREKIKDRTIRGKASRMAQGKMPQGTGRTGTAFGYSYNRTTGKREVREEEALIVADIFHLCDSGISPHRIAVILNEQGIASPMGHLWDPRTVRYMLRQEIYIGRTWSGMTRRVHVSGKRHILVPRPREEWVEIKDATPAIIDPELFHRVQERLARPFRVTGKVGVKYLLQGFVKCSCGAAICGTKMSGGHSTRNFQYYCCLNTRPRPAHPRSCNSRHIRMQELDDAIWSRVRAMVEDPDTVLSELRRRQGTPVAITEEIAKLERMKRTLDDQRQRVIKLYRFGEVGDDYVEKELKQINRLSLETDSTIDSLKARAAAAMDFEPIASRVKAYCESISAQLDSFGFDAKREVMAALQVKVTVDLERSVTLFCVLPASVEGDDNKSAGDGRYVNALHASGYMSAVNMAGAPTRDQFWLAA